MISIVLAVANGWAATFQTLLSVARTTRSGAHEIIVLDDGSTDETRLALPRLEGISLHRNDQPVGLAHARQQAVELARGEYLVFLRSGTVVEPGWLESLLREAATSFLRAPGAPRWPDREAALSLDEVLVPARTLREALSDGILRDCTIVPSREGTYGLLLHCEIDGRPLTCGSAVAYDSPLNEIAVKDGDEGRTGVVTAADLCACLGRGYDLGAQPPLPREGPARVAFTVRAGDTMGGGTINLYRCVNWLAEMGVEVAVYSDSLAPEWTSVNARYHSIRDASARYAAIEEAVVVVYSVLDLPAVIRHSPPGKHIYHFSQGAEEYHWTPPATADLSAPVPIFDLLNSLPVGRIVASPHLQDYYQQRYGRTVIPVPNGVDLDLFRPPASRERGKELTVLVAGNPHERLKGLDVVRRALALLAARRPKWRLRLVNVCGGQVARPAEKEAGFASELRCGLTPTEMRDLYQRADVYVNASWYEGFGLPSLEAMACGLPVVQTDNHGLDGIRADGRNCLVVPPRDAPRMADALERVLSDADLRRTLMAGGLATAADFSFARQREMLAAAFSGILGRALGDRRPPVTSGERPRFSVLVPSYNQAHFLSAALDSLRAQTYPEWEALVVNDGSTDGTAALMERYAREDRRIRPFHQENGGVASALNRGLAEARGEWICWLSSDDLFTPDKLAVHLDAIRGDAGLRFMHGDYQVLFDQTGKRAPSGIDVKRYIPPAEQQVLRFLEINYFNGISVAVHRSVFAVTGGFDAEYRYGQDYDCWLRASARFRSRFIERATCVTRLHPGQGTSLFTEAGIYDSSRAALAFLNTHPFEALFPLLDLSQPDQAIIAVIEAMRITASPSSFVNRCGYAAALVGRLEEWHASAQPEVRRATQEQLRYMAAHNRPDLGAMFWRLAHVAPGSFRYTPVDPVTALTRQAAKVERRGDARELAALRRYLDMIAPGSLR